MNILISGGGTAGHVFPALALGKRLASLGHEVRFAGTSTGQEAHLVSEAGFPFAEVEARPLVRGLSVRALGAPLAAIRAVRRCRPLVGSSDVVVGMGGYVSVPVALASLRARRPLVLHEQNAVPGLANRTLARGARVVALSFPEARRMLARSVRTVVTGNPVREEILGVARDRAALAEEAVAELGLEEGRRTVVVFGGSQGALHLNRATVEGVRRLSRDDVQVVLLTGVAHLDSVRAAVEGGRVPVRVLGFLERMELAYAVADLVISRSGATTVAELAVCGVPAILVPYPYATGRHQEANARALKRAGAAAMLLDDEVDGAVLAERMGALLDDEAGLRRMGERARAWARPDAAEALATAVLQAGGAP